MSAKNITDKTPDKTHGKSPDKTPDRKPRQTPVSGRGHVRPGMHLRRPAPLPLNGRRIGIMIVALVVATFFLFLAGKCSHNRTVTFGKGYPAKSGGDTLDVAIEVSPLSYSLARDTVSGLDYDLLRQMAAIHRRPVKFHPFAPLPWAMQGLREGTFDILISSLPSTSRLKDTLLLTRPVYLDRQVLVQRRADTAFVERAELLAGKTVWIADGSPLADRLANLAEEIGDTISVRSIPGRTAEHLVMLVSSGDIPRAVVNQGIAQRMCSADTTLSCNTPVSFTQFQTWAVSPQNRELLKTLNSWLSTYSRTQAYSVTLSRYGMLAPTE